MPRPRSLRPLEPIGTRLITSTPPASAESTAPLPTSAVARLVACCEEPHWVSTVVLATDSGRPALSHAVRPMLNACSPTWLTQPVTTCPTAAGSMPDRSIAAFCTVASRSAGWTVDNPPLRFPTGVRTASTITTSDMPATYRSVTSRRPLAASRTRSRAAAPMKATKTEPRSSSSKVVSSSPVASLDAAPARSAPRMPIAIVARQPRLGAPDGPAGQTAGEEPHDAPREDVHEGGDASGGDRVGTSRRAGGCQAAERPWDGCSRAALAASAERRAAMAASRVARASATPRRPASRVASSIRHAGGVSRRVS